MARKKKDETQEQEDAQAIEEQQASVDEQAAQEERDAQDAENLSSESLTEAHDADSDFDAAAARHQVYNTVNEDHSSLEDEGDFVRESREEVIGSPVVSQGGPVIHDDVDAGPYGNVQSTVDDAGKVQRSERQEQARRAVEAYEQAKRDRRGA